MKKYKLIKEYPASATCGTEVVLDAKIDRYRVPNTNRFYSKEIIENNPEFWEEVIEKDYKVLKYESPDEWIYEIGQNGLYDFENDHVYNKTEGHMINYTITSIERLSDGEIFTIGDVLDGYNNTGIKEIELRYTGLKIITDANGDGCSSSRLSWKLEDCVKLKQPLFTTEDGVSKYKGDYYWGVNTTNYNIQNYPVVDYTHASWKVLTMKTFSTKEKAEAYRLENIPILSLRDIRNITGSWWLKLDNIVKQRLKL